MADGFGGNFLTKLKTPWICTRESKSDINSLGTEMFVSQEKVMRDNKHRNFGLDIFTTRRNGRIGI